MAAASGSRNPDGPYFSPTLGFFSPPLTLPARRPRTERAWGEGTAEWPHPQGRRISGDGGLPSDVTQLELYLGDLPRGVDVERCPNLLRW